MLQSNLINNMRITLYAILPYLVAGYSLVPEQVVYQIDDDFCITVHL